MVRLFLAIMSGVAIGGVSDEAQKEAAALFESYVALEAAFDPALADLYSDAAKVHSVRRYRDGRSRTMKVPAPEYKNLIRNAMPLAKAIGDNNVYSDVSYTAEGEMVRIKATRYSKREEYYSSISLLVGPDADGRWRIREEISEGGAVEQLMALGTPLLHSGLLSPFSGGFGGSGFGGFPRSYHEIPDNIPRIIYPTIPPKVIR